MNLLPSRPVLFPSLLLACSLSFPPAPAHAAGLCLKVDTGGREALSLPIANGGKLRLSFINSVYGSSVEEVFRIGDEGLQSFRLSYAEPRLVEFYGHEGASYENGSWVVAPAPRRFKTLDLRVSGDSAIEIAVDGGVVALRETARIGANARLSVASCEANHG